MLGASVLSLELRPFDFTLLYPVAFSLALLLTLPTTRFLRSRATSLGMIDAPDGGRHLHEAPVPNVGGTAIFFACGIALAAVLGLSRWRYMMPAGVVALYPIIGGAAAMHLLGLLDDRRNLSVRTKLIAQTAIAVAVFSGGVRIVSIHFPFLGPVEFGPWLSLLLTAGWLVGLTNAFNLVDGADGVAGGAALTAALAMFVVALVLGQPVIALALAIVAGAVLGFLFFNFPPATVFLGNSGSMFVGFLLAALGLIGSLKATTALAIGIPVVSLGLPVLDSILAVVRRLIRGDRITQGDLGHIHHCLLELVHSPRKVALILYAACSVFAVASLVLLNPNLRAVGVVFFIVGVAVVVGVQRLRVPELLELRRAIQEGSGRLESAARAEVGATALTSRHVPRASAQTCTTEAHPGRRRAEASELPPAAVLEIGV
jgi:UDP-GlcNAc:undecaprenyl-phosphate GlcNAc-1-phosphate transferase